MADEGTGGRTWGLLARYDSPGALYHACERVRDAGFVRWDACMPFPVHGIDRAMGLRPSPLPWIVFGVGLCGSLFMLGFQIWTMVYDFPIVVAGKPLWSIPAFVPIWFEFTVLTSALTIFFGNWGLCGLPRLNHPLFESRAFERVTDDAFFIVVEAEDPQFDAERTFALLQSTGPSLLEPIEV